MIKKIDNFLDEKDRIILTKWGLENYEKNFFGSTNMNPSGLETRRTTRGKTDKNQIIYPKNAYDIQNKIIKTFNLYNYILPPNFVDGIACGVSVNGDAVYSHIDPVYYKDTYTLHANFIVQKPSYGGIVYIDAKEYDIQKNTLLLFVPSHLYHGVTEMKGSINRVLWSYSFCVDKNTVDRIFNNDFT